MKSFSIGSFVVGSLVGLLVGAGAAYGYLLFVIGSAGENSIPLGGQQVVDAVREKVAEHSVQQISLVGYLHTLGDGTIVIEEVEGDENTAHTFAYDENTKFVTKGETLGVVADVSITPQDFNEGDEVVVYSNTSLASQDTPYAYQLRKK